MERMREDRQRSDEPHDTIDVVAAVVSTKRSEKGIQVVVREARAPRARVYQLELRFERGLDDAVHVLEEPRELARPIDDLGRVGGGRVDANAKHLRRVAGRGGGIAVTRCSLA